MLDYIGVTPNMLPKLLDSGKYIGDYKDIKIVTGAMDQVSGAIGAGVVIFEIQQNSTLTYRLYDYMRRDKDGNLRELHVEKAMLVSDLDVYKEAPRVENSPEIIGKCEYFETAKYKLNFTNLSLFVGSESFLSVTCVAGEGTIDGEKIAKGDSFFIPAGTGDILITGGENLEILTVKIPNYRKHATYKKRLV